MLETDNYQPFELTYGMSDSDEYAIAIAAHSGLWDVRENETEYFYHIVSRDRVMQELEFGNSDAALARLGQFSEAEAELEKAAHQLAGRQGGLTARRN